MTSTQWGIRLENEYKAMCAFPINSRFSWSIAPGQKPPRVKAYYVTYYVKTKVTKAGKYQNRTKVVITLSEAPGGAPTVRIIEGEYPFHPNVYENGVICFGNMWDKEPILWKLVLNIGKLLAFDPEHTNPDSPANRAARDDWNEKQSKLRKPYPCDSVIFPHPVGY